MSKEMKTDIEIAQEAKARTYPRCGGKNWNSEESDLELLWKI